MGGFSYGNVGVIGLTDYGTGVVASSYEPNGTAIRVEGVATFSRSGVATVAGTSNDPAQKVSVSGIALTSSSLILATPQGIVAGVGIEGVVPDVAGNSFEIYLTEAIKVSLDIAWFIVG